ncbi:MAG: hypothetical protein WDO72_17305 [Pseudomonadota bacterium]
MISTRSLSIAAAVAMALGTGTASALDFATTSGLANASGQPNVLTVAGASAQRTAFLQLMNSDVCASGSLDLYRASPTSNQDFRAYSCTTVGDTGEGSIGETLGGSASTNVLVYYRSEGGSAWGPYSIAQRSVVDSIVGNNIGPDFVGIKQLNLGTGTTCNNTSSLTTVDSVLVRVHECAVAGYDILTDGEAAAIAGLANRQTQLGTADVEPKLFTGTNNPAKPNGPTQKFSAAAPVVDRLKAISSTASQGFGQVFSIIVNNNPATADSFTDDAALTNLTSSELTGIFTKTITNWCTIRPSIAGCPSTLAAINIVRREPGSGTQVAAGVEFTRAGCGDNFAFATDTAVGLSDHVFEAASSSVLESTVPTTANAIGINILKTGSSAVSNTKTLSIDGVMPLNTSAADLSYKFAYESTYTLAGNAVLPSGSVPFDLANGLITLSQDVNRIPVNTAVFAIPGLSDNDSGELGSPNGQPTAKGSRGGQSCRPMQPQ